MVQLIGKTKICILCLKEKDLSDFPTTKGKNGKIYYRHKCKDCYHDYNAEYWINNREYFDAYNKQYREEHKEDIAITTKQYKTSNKDALNIKRKIYRADNIVIINANRAKKDRQRRKDDPAFALKQIVSSIVRQALKKKGSSKRGKSITKYLPYTMNELKEHLEKQFDPWMTWDNWGKYDPKTWDDNNSSTWTWQIDHIIPQADLPYTSMVDENFQKCWSLENLRPLSAKQNNIDGTTRKRHKKK